MSSAQQYIDLYEQEHDTICRHSSATMNAVRQAAFERFSKQGFPSTKEERYRYTDIEALFAPDYGLNLNRLSIPANPYDAFRCDVPNLSTSLYFMVNDEFYTGERKEENAERIPAGLGSLPEGITIGALKDHATPRYNQLAGRSADATTDLNTMLAQDGLYVHVAKGVKADRAIQVINILKAPSPWERAGGEVALMVNRRVLIEVEEGAELKMLFCDHAADDRHFLATQVVEVFVGPNARLDLYSLEETHARVARVSNTYIDQQQDSRVNIGLVTLLGGTTRNQLDVQLSGEGAECTLNGCAIADHQQHVDNNTLITHRAPYCTSHELYKYVLDDAATGAFAGRVLVAAGAQHTTSQMTNQNLCATPQARMFTQPMLEIYADDVKCAHGATVGQMDAAALFYMRQRGLSDGEARTLLQQAFVGEVLDRIQLEPLRRRLRYLVDKRFRGELNKCKGCKGCK